MSIFTVNRRVWLRARALSPALAHVWAAACVALVLFLICGLAVLTLNALQIVGLMAGALLAAMGI